MCKTLTGSSVKQSYVCGLAVPSQKRLGTINKMQSETASVFVIQSFKL